MRRRIIKKLQVPGDTRLKRISFVGVSILIGVIGTYLLIDTKAASPYVSIEPETGGITNPARVVDDPEASGNEAVVFEATPTPPPVNQIDVTNVSQLQSALSAIASGQTIYLHDGNYEGAGQIMIQNKTFAEKVIIKGASRNGVTVGGFKITNSSNVTVRDMTISGNPGLDAGIRLENKARQLIFTNLTIKGGTYGFKVNGGAFPGGVPDYSFANWVDDVELSDSEIYGAADGDNIQITGLKNSRITRNYLHDPRDTLVHNDNIQITAADNVQITRNRLTATVYNALANDKDDQGMFIGRSDPYAANLYIKNILIANNIIYKWRGSGLIIAGADDVRLAHNTIVNSRDGAYSDFILSNKGAGFENTNVQVRNNIIGKTNLGRSDAPSVSLNAHNHIVNASNNNQQTGIINLTTGDPQLVNILGNSAADFMSRSSSPVINSAYMTNHEVTDDYNGIARSVPYDRGAFEF